MKKCGQCHSPVVGNSEEHFLSRIILHRELGGPPNNTSSFEEERKAFPLLGIEPLVLGRPIGVLVAVPIRMWRLNEERCAEEKRVCINPLAPNALDRRRAVNHLKIKIPVKNLSMQRCAEPFNAERLIKASRKKPFKN
jgi:hypothetical protein